MIRQGEGTLVPAFTKPLGILGIEGIYDLVALRDNHSDEPYYQQMVENVFGTDEVSLTHTILKTCNLRLYLRGKCLPILQAWWAACSPVSGDYNRHWPDGKLTVLVHSLEDELVESDQMYRMKAALSSQRSAALEGSLATNRLDAIQILDGKHDEIWREGTQLAKSIANAVERLVQLQLQK